MPGEHIEVAIGVKKGCLSANDRDRDEAVACVANGLACRSTRAKELGGQLEVGEPCKRQDRKLEHGPPNFALVVVPSRAGEKLHHDHFGYRQRGTLDEEAPERQVDGAARAPEQLDPS